VDSPTRLTLSRLPWRTLLVCSAATVVSGSSVLQDFLIYNREAIAAGEWWRLITGHLVHLSTLHFVYNVIAFFIVGAVFEWRRYRHFWLFCFTACLAIGTALYVAAPQWDYYGGLSGAITAAVVYVCLHGLSEEIPWRWLCGITLACVMMKLGYELAFEQKIFGSTGSAFVAVPMSHVAGAVTALLAFLLMKCSFLRTTKGQTDSIGAK
jgi:rhomboid family GlyGly-CTERM serine protease